MFQEPEKPGRIQWFLMFMDSHAAFQLEGRMDSYSFWFLDQKHPYLQTFPLRAASFALSSALPDFPLILKYKRFFFSICKKVLAKICDQSLSAFPCRSCCEHLPDLRVLVLNWLVLRPPPARGESHQLFGCRTDTANTDMKDCHNFIFGTSESIFLLLSAKF